MAIEIIQEDTLVLTLTVVDSAGDPIDLTSGYTARFVVWRRGDATASIDIDQTDANLDLAADGVVTATVDSDECTTLGTYVSQIQVETTDTPPISRSKVTPFNVTDGPALNGLGS